MASQDKPNLFSVESAHRVSNVKHLRQRSKIYSPEEFLALPMVQEFIRKNPNQHFVNEDTGEVMLAQELAELYCSVNNGKKMKKALRRAFGEKV